MLARFADVSEKVLQFPGALHRGLVVHRRPNQHAKDMIIQPGDHLALSPECSKTDSKIVEDFVGEDAAKAVDLQV